MSYRRSLETLFSIPYKIGGLKNINLKNSFIRSEFFDDSNTNSKNNYDQSDIFSFLILPGKLSKKTYNHIDKLYSNYLNDIMNPEIFKAFSENSNNKDISVDNRKYNHYSKSYLKKINNLFTENNKNYFEEWKSCIKSKFDLYECDKRRNLKNEIIFDKIFIHLNYVENSFDQDSLKIKHAEHNPSKKFYVFNYKPKSAPVANKFKVRLSFWIKATNPLIIDKTSDCNNKIHKDEFHHMLVELEDDIEELNYLKIFSRFSLLNLFWEMISSKKDYRMNTTEKVLANLKICDFDFFVGESDNFNRSADKDGYNECFYIKFL